MKNIKNQPASRSRMRGEQGGFLELIIVIIIVLVLMKNFGFTITGFINWVRDLFYSVL